MLRWDHNRIVRHPAVLSRVRTDSDFNLRFLPHVRVRPSRGTMSTRLPPPRAAPSARILLPAHGTLHSRSRPCGERNCCCATDSDAWHGPYHDGTRRKNDASSTPQRRDRRTGPADPSRDRQPPCDRPAIGAMGGRNGARDPRRGSRNRLTSQEMDFRGFHRAMCGMWELIPLTYVFETRE